MRGREIFFHGFKAFADLELYVKLKVRGSRFLSHFPLESEVFYMRQSFERVKKFLVRGFGVVDRQNPISKLNICHRH